MPYPRPRWPHVYCCDLWRPGVVLCYIFSYAQLREMTRERTVVVLPAFETAPQRNMTLAHELADAAAMMTKEQLGRLVQKRLIYQFALYLFRQVCAAHPAGCCCTRGMMHQAQLLQAQRGAAVASHCPPPGKLMM